MSSIQPKQTTIIVESGEVCHFRNSRRMYQWIRILLTTELNRENSRAKEYGL
jgi:hypothetical protein